MHRPLIVIAFFTIVATSSFCQNLVRNPGFEFIKFCPDALSGVYYNKVYEWSSPSIGSTDYFHTCATSPDCMIPNTIIGYQKAHSGLSFAGLAPRFFLDLNYPQQEYLQGKLHKSMISGHAYAVEFYVSCANEAGYIVDRVGVNFNTDSVFYPTDTTLPLFPNVVTPAFNYLSDTTNWMKVSGLYTATGNYDWFIIGNFTYDTSFHFIQNNPSAIFDYASYLFIDDVSIVDITETDTIKVCNGDSAEVGNQYFYTTGWNSDSVGEVLISRYVYYIPDTTYSIFEYCAGEDVLVNGFSFETDTNFVIQTINQLGCDSVAFITINEKTDCVQEPQVSPNPVQDELLIRIPQSMVGKVKFSLYDATGKLVLEHVPSQSIELINCRNLATALYFYSFTTENIIYKTGKILKL